MKKGVLNLRCCILSILLSVILSSNLQADDSILDMLPGILAAANREGRPPPPPRPRPITGRVDILSFVTIPGLGAPRLVGQIYNGTNTAIKDAQIVVINEFGEQYTLERGFREVYKTLIAPGETACFSVLALPEDRFYRGTLTPHKVVFTNQRREVPRVSFGTISTERTFRGNTEFNASFIIRGNIGIPGPTLIATSYDENGLVNQCSNTRLNALGLSPGRIYRLSVDTRIDYDTLSSFELDIGGDFD